MKTYKLTNPQTGEENLIYILINYNEVTNNCIIECINSGLFINPTELVNFQEITEIK